MIHDDSINSRPVQIMIDSIERRWAACDQDVCIAAIILHPLYKTAPFAKIQAFVPANMLVLMKCLWTRFYRTPPPLDLFSEFNAYISGKGIYAVLTGWSADAQKAAEAKVRDYRSFKLF